MPLEIARPPETDDELWHWVRAVWGVTIPRTAVCDGHTAPFDAFADAFFARSPVSIWKASRGFGGKSFLLGCLALTEAVALGAQITVLGGSAQQSQNVHEHTQGFWYAKRAPKALLEGAPTQFRTKLTTGAWILALLASQTSVRGPHPQRLRLDEIDEMELEILESAQGQPMAKSGIKAHTVMCVAGFTMVTTRRGEIPVVEVTPEDHVLTRGGWRQVRAVTMSGYKPVVDVLLSNGRTLTCTDDHRIATPSGWIVPRDMVAGQEVCGIRSDRPVQEPVTVVDITARAAPVLPVYDIEVDGIHEFTAEGIVIHNSSTHQYPDRTMAAMLERAGQKGWPVYHWCFHETSNPVDGWLTEEEIVQKKAEVSDRMFAIEYELQEPSFGGRAIATEFVDWCFTPERGEWMGEPDEEIIIEEYDPTGSYITGVDWAKEQDWTVIRTFRTDVHPWREAAFMRTGRKPWPLMVRNVESRLQRYKGILVHDATGIGDVLDDLIDYPRRLVKPVVLRGRDRESAFTEYISGIEQRAILSARIDYPHSEHRFATYKDFFGKGHPPDSFIAGAVAWMWRNKGNHPEVAPVSITRAGGTSPWAIDSMVPTRL